MSTFLFRPLLRATTGSTDEADASFGKTLALDASFLIPGFVGLSHGTSGTGDPGADPGGPTGGIVPASETVTLAGSQLVFVNTYLSGVTDAYRTAVLYAEHELESHFSNNVTITVSFGFADLGPNFLAQNTFHNSVHATYANLRAALIAHATTADDIAATNTLPVTDPSGGGLVVPYRRRSGEAAGTSGRWAGLSAGCPTGAGQCVHLELRPQQPERGQWIRRHRRYRA
jgi:hypothetical protein